MHARCKHSQVVEFRHIAPTVAHRKICQQELQGEGLRQLHLKTCQDLHHLVRVPQSQPPVVGRSLLDERRLVLQDPIELACKPVKRSVLKTASLNVLSCSKHCLTICDMWQDCQV